MIKINTNAVKVAEQSGWKMAYLDFYLCYFCDVAYCSVSTCEAHTLILIQSNIGLPLSTGPIDKGKRRILPDLSQLPYTLVLRFLAAACILVRDFR